MFGRLEAFPLMRSRATGSFLFRVSSGALPCGSSQHIPSLTPLLNPHRAMAYNGFTVVTKAGKEFIDQNGRPKIKSNVNVELAIDAMEIAPRIDQMVLFSGDGDLRSLVQAV